MANFDDNARALLDVVAGLPDSAQVPVGFVRETLGQGGNGMRLPEGRHEIDLTVPEVAQLLGLSRSTVRHYGASGKIRAYRRARREWRFPRAALREYLDGEHARHVAERAAATAETPSARTQRRLRRF